MTRRSIGSRCVMVLLVSLLAACAGPGRSRFAGTQGASPNIRVLLGTGDKACRVSSTGGFTVQAAGGTVVLRSSGGGALKITTRGATLNLETEPGGELAASDDAVAIVPDARSVLGFNDIQYDGSIRVSTDGAGMVSIVNVVPLESYLEGVLPHEMGNPGADGYDALKAQAVAARTYAYQKMADRRSEVFDVYATVQDQIYGGQEARTKVASAAVRDTRGQVIESHGELVKAYYSACCGGHTADIRLAWPDREPADYLHGILDQDPRTHDAFCADNRYFRWRYSFSGRELGDILRVTLPKTLGVSANDVGALVDLRVLETTASGRVRSLEIQTTMRTFTVTGDQIRWVLELDPRAGRILPSTMFRIDKTMERAQVAFVSFAGGGNGHGVGMCQSGAIGMARRGYTYEMILEHYYTGCAVTAVY
jgi:stage II sporulation protein D